MDNSSFILVLGMHRSGTSCLTGMLERCGVYLGDVRREGKFNKKGYFEIKVLQEIHDRILEKHGVAWYDPRVISVIDAIDLQQMRTIAYELKSKGVCAVKDPRVLFFLDVWKNLAGSHCKMIGTFRHPMAVAESLLARNKMPIEEGLKLWISYNTLLVEEHRKQPFPLVHFDLQEPKKYLHQILRISEKFNLKPQKIRLRFFVSSRLEHHNYMDSEVPDSCKELYTYLIQNR